MTLATIIHDRTNDGTSIVEFLFAVMRDELDGFKPCHRLDAAKLLVKYDRDEARNYLLDYPPEPSQPGLDSRSPVDTYFNQKLAKVIQESTDDGRTVCRFLINVMDGALSAFKPHHRLSAARELLDRGFGKHATPRRSGEEPDHTRGDATVGAVRELPSPRRSGGGRNPEEGSEGGTHSSTPPTQPTKSEKSPNPTNQSPDNITPDEDDIPWDEINKIIDDAIEESNRILAEQGIDPDNPPYVPDYSAFD